MEGLTDTNRTERQSDSQFRMWDNFINPERTKMMKNVSGRRDVAILVLLGQKWDIVGTGKDYILLGQQKYGDNDARVSLSENCVNSLFNGAVFPLLGKRRGDTNRFKLYPQRVMLPSVPKYAVEHDKRERYEQTTHSFHSFQPWQWNKE